MKTLLLLGFALAIADISLAAEVPPIFNATLTSGRQSRFVLVAPDGKSSSWLTVGDSFAGYQIKAYDPTTTTLTVEKDGKTSTIALASDAAIAAGTSALPAAPVSLADAEAVLNKMHFDELVTHAVARQKKMVEAQLVQGMARMASQGVSAEDAADFKKKMLDTVESVMDPTQLKPQMTKIMSEVYNKEELDAMAAFYTTPIGEKIVSKQSDMQDKLGTFIQQRMMEVMPKVQQISQQFAMQQQAKKQAAAAAAAAASPAPGAAPAPAPAQVPTPAPKP